MEFCKAFNAKTQGQEGMIIPVIITVFSDRSFTFITKSPPATVLLKQAAGIAKGSAHPTKAIVGSVTQEQVKKIAQAKMQDLNCYDVEKAMKIIAGSAKSIGIKIEG